MDQELSRQEIQEIKKVSRELENHIMLTEGMKDVLTSMLKGFGSKNFGFLGTNLSRLKKVLDLLKRSDQFANLLGGSNNPTQIAQTLQTILLSMKINNPELNVLDIVKKLLRELAKDSKDIEKLLASMGLESGKNPNEKQKEPEPSDRGLMSARGTASTTPIKEVFGGNQNKLAEIVSRKVINKLIVK